jgi:hypothetical protein
MEMFEDHELVASGAQVTAIALDSNVVIFAGANRDHEFRIENDIRLSSSSSEVLVHFSPYDEPRGRPAHITELAALVTLRIAHARAYLSGVLELVFEDGTVATVEPKSRTEAWTYTHGTRVLACPPGGRLT